MAIDERTTRETAPRAPLMETPTPADDLERLLGSELPASGSGGLLAAGLVELEADLLRRYETESRSALYQDVASGKPWLASRLTELRAEHRALAKRAGGLAARARDADAGGRPGDLQAEGRTLLHDLRHHEEAERRLLSDALFVDIGVAD